MEQVCALYHDHRPLAAARVLGQIRVAEYDAFLEKHPETQPIFNEVHAQRLYYVVHIALLSANG